MEIKIYLTKRFYKWKNFNEKFKKKIFEMDLWLSYYCLNKMWILKIE